MQKVAFHTLGCKVNQYDTAAILTTLPESYYSETPFSEKADIYIINTCTVTHRADAEARQLARQAKRLNPEGVVILTGCYAQVAPEEIARMEEVDYVVGNSDRFTLRKAILEAQVQDVPKVMVSDIFRTRRFETPEIKTLPSRTRAYLKVQDGCNYRCTFCIIPYARGYSRSLSIPEVLGRIEELAETGHKEVVLTGVHLASYGKDIKTGFIDLLEEIDKRAIVPRVRLSSFDPADLTEDIIDFVGSSKTICPQFHVPLQSGDGDVLKRMRRRYTPEDFIRCLERIKDRMPEAGIGTDIMVGFPGEEDEHFNNTYSLAKSAPLTYFHVFPYSRRRGTPAAKMSNQVPSYVVNERSKALRELGNLKKRDFYKGFIGRRLPVLVEESSRGTTPNYIKVRILDGDSFRVGEETEVEITRISGSEVLGVAF